MTGRFDSSNQADEGNGRLGREVRDGRMEARLGGCSRKMRLEWRLRKMREGNGCGLAARCLEGRCQCIVVFRLIVFISSFAGKSPGTEEDNKYCVEVEWYLRLTIRYQTIAWRPGAGTLSTIGDAM